MRLLIQRVNQASVLVNNSVISTIYKGLVVFCGIGQLDNPQSIKKMAAKLAKLRIFSNHLGKFDYSVQDLNYEVLAISQFTLYANLKKGNRPDFSVAKAPDEAKELYLLFTQELQQLGVKVALGVFGANMQVELCNDGPVTIWLEDD